MGLTKAQWSAKLKDLVPSWVFEKRVENIAVFKGLGATLEAAQEMAVAHVRETFIDTGSDEYVAQHGIERSVTRLPFETLGSYRLRVKRITNRSNKIAIKEIVDALLIRGECTIIEHYDAALNYYDREIYLDRNIIDFDVLYNAFTIIIDFQIPPARSFLDRGIYLDREFLLGAVTSSDQVFSNVIQAVNENKAFGTVYRLIERANP